MRIAGIDSGKQRDSFAFVGTEIKNDDIYVLGVKTWLGRKYIEVENLIANIHDTQPFDYYVVEVNNTGEHVYEELKTITPLLRTSDYMVVEDTIKEETMSGMMKFMNNNDYYTYDSARESKFGMTMSKNGFWIRK